MVIGRLLITLVTQSPRIFHIFHIDRRLFAIQVFALPFHFTCIYLSPSGEISNEIYCAYQNMYLYTPITRYRAHRVDGTIFDPYLQANKRGHHSQFYTFSTSLVTPSKYCSRKVKDNIFILYFSFQFCKIPQQLLPPEKVLALIFQNISFFVVFIYIRVLIRFFI